MDFDLDFWSFCSVLGVRVWEVWTVEDLLAHARHS